jgi:hypothetical protein
MCHYCGAKVGEAHKPGCRMEVCPVCGRQLIKCGHSGEVEKGKFPRIPFIRRTVACTMCGRLYPRFFKVEKEDWEKYVIPPLQRRVLCRRCYDQMKVLFPDGWNKAGK